MAEKRRYELKARAARLEETRRRIVEATVDLHRSVGPAATQITEIARRAGVQRLTVYNHFPDEASLLSACSAHWRGLHPAPDPASWRDVEEGGARLRLGLEALYAWFRETEPMTAHVLRDAEVVPVLGEIVRSGLGRYMEGVATVLAEPFGGGVRVDAAVRAACSFHFWRSLSGLGDAEAAKLGAGLVELAAR